MKKGLALIVISSSTKETLLTEMTTEQDRRRADDKSTQRRDGMWECWIPDELWARLDELRVPGESDDDLILRCVAINKGRVS